VRGPPRTLYCEASRGLLGSSGSHPPGTTKDDDGEMARKTRSIRELRAEAEAAEALGKTTKAKKATKAKKTTAAKTSKAKTAKKTAAKKTTRRKVAKEARYKAYWGVFTQGMKRVAMFEYADRKAAEKKAGELVNSSRAHHFVGLVKEAITE